MTGPKIESNIWKLLADRFIANFWLFMPVLVPYYETHGLRATQIFMVQAAFNLALSAFEIPTGYLSDAFGRRRTLLVGALLFPLGILLYIFLPTFWGFVVAETVIALALSLRSGTDSALLYETLLVMGRQDEHKKQEGSAHFAERTGSAVAAILGGFASSLGLVVPFVLNAVSSLFLLPLAWSLKEPIPVAAKPESMIAHVKKLKESLCFVVSHDVIRYAGLYNAAIFGVGLAAYFTNYLYYGKLGLAVAVYGVIVAVNGFCAALGGKLAHRIERRVGLGKTLLLPFVMSLVFFALSLVQHVFVLPLLAVNSFVWGLQIPLFRDIVHRSVPSEMRATTLSALSMLVRFAYVVIGVFVGFVIDHGGLGWGYASLGALLLAFGLPTALRLTSLLSPSNRKQKSRRSSVTA